jgi:hypothetical protein
MAYWTIIGKGFEDNTTNRSFGVTLDTGEKTWIANGPSVDLFFTTKSGSFRTVLVPERGIRLEDRADDEVAFFTNLTGATPVGGTGRGRSHTGVLFDWKLDSK